MILDKVFYITRHITKINFNSTQHYQLYKYFTNIRVQSYIQIFPIFRSKSSIVQIF